MTVKSLLGLSHSGSSSLYLPLPFLGSVVHRILNFDLLSFSLLSSFHNLYLATEFCMQIAKFLLLALSSQYLLVQLRTI